MKILAHLTVQDICDIVWEHIKDNEISSSYRKEFAEPDFHFTFDDNQDINGIDVSTETYEEKE